MASADRLIEVFGEAKARPAGAERDRFLAEACRDEPALKEQVLVLLQAHDGAGDFLKNPIPSPAALPTEKPGDRIGRYKLLEQIGEGGCGVVYMAEQEEPVRRRVALKVIKLGMDTKQVIARFEAERQVLAMMDHPNIAKIYDAGVTGSNADFPVGEDASRASESGRLEAATGAGWKTGVTGRPYFVMELVRGIKITDYCDQNNLSTEERLKLFTQVCQAVQHAHQKGIIHRDIKPSNILVTQDESVAIPKVIDFGIAKATTDQRLTNKTVFTAFEQFLGTPAYMSPEQAMMTSLDIDTRTDIYALGVLLYELLTGTTPFDANELMAAGLDAMRRTICEQEPARPSTKLSQALVAAEVSPLKSTGGKRATEAEIRTSSRRLLRLKETIPLLRGDLDWIVMKALEKDRSRRYETATGLAMDVQRHLSNEPVTARPPSAAYRFQKLVRRNKLAFAAASAIVAALVLGLGLSTWMFFKENQARQRAVAAEQEQARLRQKAEMEAAEGRQLKHFLGDLAMRLLHERNLTNAEAVLRHELALERKLSGDEHTFVAGSLLHLANVLQQLGRLSEAEIAAREALLIRRNLFGNEHAGVANALEWLARVVEDEGKLAEAETLYREQLAIRRNLPIKEQPDMAVAIAQLTVNLLRQQKFAEAEPFARECLALREEKTPDHWLTFNARSLLGGSLLGQHKYAEAEPLLLSGYEGLKEREAKMPVTAKAHPQKALERLVQLYEATGDAEKAAEWKQKLAEFERAEAEGKTAAPKP